MPASDPEDGARVRVASGDYTGCVGTYEGRCDVTGAHLVHLDNDAVRDPAVQCDRVESAADRGEHHG